MTGKVCDKHQEWCPTGECRWCEPEKPLFAVVHLRTCASVLDSTAPCNCKDAGPSPFARAANAMIAAAQARIHASWAWTPSVRIFHYPMCPLKGAMDPDQTKDLAAGCTCLPVP